MRRRVLVGLALAPLLPLGIAHLHRAAPPTETECLATGPIPATRDLALERRRAATVAMTVDPENLLAALEETHVCVENARNPLVDDLVCDGDPHAPLDRWQSAHAEPLSVAIGVTAWPYRSGDGAFAISVTTCDAPASVPLHPEPGETAVARTAHALAWTIARGRVVPDADIDRSHAALVVDARSTDSPIETRIRREAKAIVELGVSDDMLSALAAPRPDRVLPIAVEPGKSLVIPHLVE